MKSHNPFPSGTGSHKAWGAGRDAGIELAYRKMRDELEEKQEATGVLHPDCEECTERKKHMGTVKVMFQLEHEGEMPPASAIARALVEGIPKEWWADSTQADWGVVAIMPLDDDGNLRMEKLPWT